MSWEDILKRGGRNVKRPPSREKPKTSYSRYVKPEIQVKREEAMERRKKAQAEADERRKKREEEKRKKEEFDKSPDGQAIIRNHKMAEEFAIKEASKYGVLSCRKCGQEGSLSPYAYAGGKKCSVCGNEFKTEGEDYVIFIKPEEFKNPDDVPRKGFGERTYAQTGFGVTPYENPNLLDWEKDSKGNWAW